MNAKHRIGTFALAAALVTGSALLVGCGDEAASPTDVAAAESTDRQTAASNALAAPGAPSDPSTLERSVRFTDDGIEILVESDDPDVVRHLHERLELESSRPRRGPAPTDITITRTATGRGILTMITGSTPEAIARIQGLDLEAPTMGPGPRGPRGDRGARPEPRDRAVTRSVTLTDTGIEILLTSDDPTVVERLQNRPEDARPRPDDVVVTVTNVDNGVLVTETGTTAEAIERIQTRAQEPPRGSHRALRG
ncbi:hypothetical protein FJZ36_17805 [Candidatus Poribacteria bacterium]|nr:hypothetical protein [Candidatus Poribacteria bacterium]